MPRPFRALLLLPFVLAAATAGATTVVRMDTRALVTRSSDIVVGEVSATRSYWDESRTRILTDVTVRVESRLKGGAGGELTLTQLGGVVDGLRYHIEGSAAFAPGEEALLFVWRDPQGRAQVNGLAQGKFEIRRDAAGRATVQRSLPGLGVGDLKSLRPLRAGEAAPSLALDDLLAEVRRVLAEEGGR